MHIGNSWNNRWMKLNMSHHPKAFSLMIKMDSRLRALYRQPHVYRKIRKSYYILWEMIFKFKKEWMS
jgi:hypothetical protein